ncbi:hypothetical protein PVK06_047404 [Gossypium arboreum]|uniref:Uncharacterized protein n=1 Tax=Gossypium arboreum TaxID=29729 RepID=A0ABR0MDK7_GOSAR|nr:hypothetical protein PVK06_047404 [Gossypium arboreum]
MDFDGKQDCEDQSSETLKESSASLVRVPVQESKVNAVLLASSSDNLEVGTKALTQFVREVLEKVFEASLKRNRELEPQFAKRVKMQLGDSKGNVEGSSGGVRSAIQAIVRQRREHALDASLRSIELGSALVNIETVSKWVS